jgi:hypothetical protein
MMKVLSNRNKLGWCAAASIYLFFFVVYFPLLLATVVVLEGTPPLDLLAIKATDSLIRNCNMEPTEVVDSQFTKAADYFSKVKIKREEQANAFIYFFGITPLKLYENQNHNIGATVGALFNKMPAGYPSTNGSTKIKSFLKTELLSKAGSDYNWMKQYSLLLLRTTRELEKFCLI